MKKPLLFLALLTAVLHFSSCQKELSVETGSTPSEGSLQSDVTGDCLPKNVNGIYEAGTALNGATNYIEVQVSVITTGAYTISTDTLNGIYFRAVGVFTSAGLTTVKLKGNGTPTNAGVTVYLVQYNASQCAVAVTTVAAGGATPAVLTLAGSPNACMVSNTAGTYTAGVPLDISNTVTIGVNVTTAGSYNITTVVSNGLIFSGTGVVEAGAQTIQLIGSGTPAAAGTTNVVVTVGTSTCSFTITVDGSAPVTNNDYFPLTPLSWWSYDDPDGIRVTGDSLTVVNVNSGTYIPTGVIYHIFQHQNETTPQDSFYYRKNGGDYLDLNIADYYTGTVLFGRQLLFDEAVIDEINFLKQPLTTNQTWESKEYSGTITGITMKLKYTFKCIDDNATVTVNGKTYTNVYKVSWKPQIKIDPSPVFGDEFVSHESWYAKGVGLIQWTINDLTGTLPPSIISLKNYKVF